MTPHALIELAERRGAQLVVRELAAQRKGRAEQQREQPPQRAGEPLGRRAHLRLGRARPRAQPEQLGQLQPTVGTEISSRLTVRLGVSRMPRLSD